MSIPNLIRKRDGRLVPIQPEKISRTLFAITEELGSPDSFLAHELAESVLHFLTLEDECEVSTARLAEMVVKVVRELGHPSISKLYENSLCRKPPRSLTAPAVAPSNPLDGLVMHRPVLDDYRIARESFIQYSLTRLYPGDLVSAHRDGLIELLDLAYPPLLSASVLSPNEPLPLDNWKLFESIREARGTTGWLVAIDGLEQSLATQSGFIEVARAYLEQLRKVLELNQLIGVLNLNCAEPPAWAGYDTGPLFPSPSGVIVRARVDQAAEQLINAYEPSRHLNIDWHLSERDLQPEHQPRLERIIAKAIQYSRIDFVFDRPRQPVHLGPGLERGGPPVLGHLRLVLNRFVEMLGGGPLDPDLYLRKLATLARFARTAGYVRQDYLRRLGAPVLQTGFTLERARLLVFHKGLIEATMSVLGPSADESSIVELGSRSLEVIQATLEDSPLRTMSTCLDWAVMWDHPSGDEYSIFEKLGEGNQIWRRQLRHAKRLSRVDGNGVLSINGNRASISIQHVSEVLRTAWKSDLSRVRFEQTLES